MERTTDMEKDVDLKYETQKNINRKRRKRKEGRSCRHQTSLISSIENLKFEVRKGKFLTYDLAYHGFQSCLGIEK